MSSHELTFQMQPPLLLVSIASLSSQQANVAFLTSCAALPILITVRVPYKPHTITITNRNLRGGALDYGPPAAPRRLHWGGLWFCLVFAAPLQLFSVAYAEDTLFTLAKGSHSLRHSPAIFRAPPPILLLLPRATKL